MWRGLYGKKNLGSGGDERPEKRVATMIKKGKEISGAALWKHTLYGLSEYVHRDEEKGD